jgi:hypothetical protein
MTTGQAAVLDVIEQYGPLTDAALVPLVQHVSNVRMSSSGIRTRRNELVSAGKITQSGEVKMPSGRAAALWSA